MEPKGTKADLSNKKVKNTVHQDRDWVTRINNELGANGNWNQQWGYLSGGVANLKDDTTTKKAEIDNQIKQLQAQIQKIDAKNLTTTNSQYGNGQKLEIFQNDKFNIVQGKDLRSLERKLPKNWKKQKWTPPEDPFDELKNLNKKKK